MELGISRVPDIDNRTKQPSLTPLNFSSVWCVVLFMPHQDEYLRKAIDCLMQAEALPDPQERAALVAIAETYAEMAKYVGKLRGTAHQEPGTRTRRRLGA
jgi:hypothetical protein